MDKKVKITVLTNRLTQLLEKEEPCVITLNGEWGVGKTHFWNKFRNQYIETTSKSYLCFFKQKKRIPYVSLFGKNSLQDIKTDIVLQVNPKSSKVRKLQNWIGSSKITGIDVSSILSLFTKNDFQDVIICLDDFERKSKNIPLKDILGLISELKEQKNCKVIMILNQDKLIENSDLSDLSEYKDKIIDYEFKYEPTPLDSYNLIKDKLECYEHYFLSYIQKYNINNIRIMRRVVNSLNDFSFTLPLVREYPMIEQEIVENIIEISTINSMNSSIDYHKLSDYQKEKKHYEWDLNRGGHSTFEINEKYNDLLSFIDCPNGYFYISDITQYVIDYVTSSILFEEHLIKMIDTRKRNNNRESILNQIRTIRNDFNFNLNYKINQYITDLFEVLKTNSSEIISILDFENFIFYIQELEQFDPDNKDSYHRFGVDLLKSYLPQYLKTDDRYSGFREDSLNKVKQFDKELLDYIDQENSDQSSQKIDSKEKIIELMLNPRKHNGWGEEPHLLSVIDEKILRKYILEDKKFLEEIFYFLRWVNNFSGETNFQPYKEKIINVLTDLQTSGDQDCQLKIQKMIDSLNL